MIRNMIRKHERTGRFLGADSLSKKWNVFWTENLNLKNPDTKSPKRKISKVSLEFLEFPLLEKRPPCVAEG